MMIQPGIALAFANDCGEECSSSFTCEGCGCCEVATQAEKCDCCGGGSQVGSSGGCCKDSSGSSAPDEFTRDDCDLDSGEALELKVIVISTTESVISSDSQEPDNNQVVSGCHCGFESQPIGDSSPVRPTVEQRDSVAVRFADLATIFGGVVPRPPRIAGSDEAMSPPRFSQIHLCIWRL